MLSNNTHLLISLLVVLIAASCVMDYSGRVSIDCTNNSDEDLWFSHTDPNLIGPPIRCGDRVYQDKKAFFFVKKCSSSLIFDSPTKNGWDWIKKYEHPDSLRIQVWDDELIQEVGWEEFVQNMGTKYKYELEYVLDIDDLEKLDYRITYPPSGAIEQLRIVYPE